MTALEIITELKRERKRQRKTKKQICELEMENGYALYQNTLCNYENKRIEPSLTRTCLWARALGMELVLVPKGGRR